MQTSAKWEIAIVGVLAAALYSLTTAPSVYFVDSNEFVVTASLLGNPHPPGHPLYTALAYLFSLLPIGSLAFRVNLFSALTAVGALSLFASLGQQLLRELAPSMGARSRLVLVVASALPLIGAQALWFQAVRAEVYALHLLVVVAALHLALNFLRGRLERSSEPSPPDAFDARPILVLALLLGLGMGNHHFLLVLALPGLLLLLLLRAEGRALFRGAPIAWCVAFGLLGLTIYALVPLRSLAGAIVDWGDARSLSRFLDVVSARMFQGSVSETTGVDVVTNTGRIALFTLGELGPWVSVLGLAGIALALWRWPRLGLPLLVLWIGNVASKALMTYDPTNPDAAGYLTFGLVVATLSALVGLAALYERILRPFGRRIVVGVFAAGVLASLVFTAPRAFERCNLRTFRASEALTLTLLEQLPRDSVLLSSYYTIFFNHWYFAYVERRRPDIEISHLSFAMGTKDGGETIRQLCRLGYDLCPVASAYHRQRAFPGALLASLAKRRPVFLENQARWLLAPGRLTPFAYALALDAPPPRAEFWSTVRRRMGPHDWTLEVRQLHFWFHVLAAAGWLRRLEPEAAGRALTLAESIPNFPGLSRVPQLVWLRNETRRVSELLGRVTAAERELARVQGACRVAGRGLECYSRAKARLDELLRLRERARRYYRTLDWERFVEARGLGPS